MPVRQARARSRQERILSAAADVFARQGYGRAAVDEVARESTTSKGGLYFHFPGKESLLLALLDQMAALLERKVSEAMASHDEPVARAGAALRTLLATLAEHEALAKVFLVEAMAAGPRFHRRVLAAEDRFAGLIRQELERAVAQGVIAPVDAGVVAAAWVGMLSAVITRWLLRPRAAGVGALEATYPTLLALMLRGVGAEAAASRAASGEGL